MPPSDAITFIPFILVGRERKAGLNLRSPLDPRAATQALPERGLSSHERHGPTS